MSYAEMWAEQAAHQKRLIDAFYNGDEMSPKERAKVERLLGKPWSMRDEPEEED